MGLTYVGSAPTRFQFGDLVTGIVSSIYPPGKQTGDAWGKHVYEAGSDVEGRIINWTNHDPQSLNRGSVEIRLDNGDRLWVTATRVITTRAHIDHPLAAMTPVQQFQWTCRCGKSGVEDTEAQARYAHTKHGDHA